MNKILQTCLAIAFVVSIVGCTTTLTDHEKRSLSVLTTSIEQQQIVVANYQEQLAKIPDEPAHQAERQKAIRDLETKQHLLKALEDRFALERKKLIEQH
jgi:hypothetical protein